MNRLKFIDRMSQGKVTRRQMLAGAGAFGVGLTVMSRMPKADPLVCLEWAGYDTPDHFGSYVAKHGAPPSFSIFANEQELKALYETSDFDTGLKLIRNDVRLAIVTKSEQGALAIENGELSEVPAFPIDKLVDTTGAGDLFASGFLFGLARGLPHLHSLRLGALAAAEVIQHVGARPQTNLKTLAQENGLM